MEEQRHPEGARLITDSCLIAIKEVGRVGKDSGVIRADDVVDGLIDLLASFVAGAPSAATLRSKRLYLEELNKRLKDRVDEYQAVAVRERGAGLLLPGLGRVQ